MSMKKAFVIFLNIYLVACAPVQQLNDLPTNDNSGSSDQVAEDSNTNAVSFHVNVDTIKIRSVVI